jgi:hypothetical protein
VPQLRDYKRPLGPEGLGPLWKLPPNGKLSECGGLWSGRHHLHAQQRGFVL